jgi:hypothetical protein
MSEPAFVPDIEAVLRYCQDVQAAGTANERAVAQTVARMLAPQQNATPDPSDGGYAAELAARRAWNNRHPRS